MDLIISRKCSVYMQGECFRHLRKCTKWDFTFAPRICFFRGLFYKKFRSLIVYTSLFLKKSILWIVPVSLLYLDIRKMRTPVISCNVWSLTSIASVSRFYCMRCLFSPCHSWQLKNSSNHSVLVQKDLIASKEQFRSSCTCAWLGLFFTDCYLIKFGISIAQKIILIL